MTTALLLLGAAGSLLSLYAALASYGRLGAGTAPCADGGTACENVFQTRPARLFGVPNALFGLGFYALVLATAVLGADAPPGLLTATRAASVAAVAAGVYLSYQLLFRLRMRCRVCFASHALNACILLVVFFLS
jgi:uncharacterized membrane protein